MNIMPIKIDKLIRSRRRSISLEITRDAQLVVRMPKYASLREVKKFIMEKRTWIEKKSREMSERIDKHIPKRFTAGEKFYYLGERYELKITNANMVCRVPTLKFKNRFYLPEENQAYGRSIFIKWYKRQAKLNIPKRVRWYADRHEFEYRKIKVTSASRRWGSCTIEGNLNFSWKLILLPVKIVDYVVVHELAHLKQHNHSKNFWLEVGKMLPDYKDRRKWLRRHGEEYVL